MNADYTRTGRIVIAGVWCDAAIVMAASAYNGGRAFAALGEPFGAGLALGVAVDVGLAVALVGDRALHLAGRASKWGRALRITTAIMALALNCGVAVWHQEWGVAAFHAFLPVLLVILAEYAQDSTLLFGSVADDAAAERQRAAIQADRRERELVASLASTLAIGARLTWPVERTPAVRQPAQRPAPVRQSTRTPELAQLVERARPLLAANPRMGRPALATELGITSHWARRVLDEIGSEQRRPVALVREA